MVTLLAFHAFFASVTWLTIVALNRGDCDHFEDFVFIVVIGGIVSVVAWPLVAVIYGVWKLSGGADS